MKKLNLEIKRMSPSLKDDFLKFFDTIAFVDNPSWASCYCQCYLLDHKVIQWGKRTAEDNRNDAILHIERDELWGHLAFIDKSPISWCHMGAKKNLPPLVDGDSQDVASIFCFLVAKPYRGQGVSRKLLDASIEFLRTKKFEIIEGYPIKNPESEADNYHGSLSMFLEAGFTLFKEKENGRMIVRKEI